MTLILHFQQMTYYWLASDDLDAAGKVKLWYSFWDFYQQIGYILLSWLELYVGLQRIYHW